MKLKWIVLTVVALALVAAIYYGSRMIPIATGYGAKIMCSSVFVSGRKAEDVKSRELNFSPVSMASFDINYKDSSVTCSLFGMATQKAIFRQGLGATLIRDLGEEEVRAQRFNLVNTNQPGGVIQHGRDTMAWPMGEKIVDTFPDCVDSLKVANAVQRIFENNIDTVVLNQTRALIVLYNGRIIAEKYAEGYTKQTKLLGWSMTKSITSALIGILVNQGKLKLDGPAPVPEWKDEKDPRHAISIRHLLHQTSGLDFEEVYDRYSDANRMLFLEGDAAAYVAGRPLKNPPGTDFRYSSGNTNLLSRIIRQTTGEANYHAYPYTAFFHPLGMYNTIMEPDASGTFVGSSFCYATARDWARFGLLYFNKGMVNGKQILSPQWISQTVTPSSAAEQGEYGYQWWLNAGKPLNSANRVYPALPADMFYADGFEGQHVLVIPSTKLVIVRLGLTKKSDWGEVQLIRDLMSSITVKASAVAN